MSIWLTLAELKARYTAARIDDLSGDDDVVAQAAIDDAEGRVKTKLLTRYAESDLPALAASTPATMKRIVARLSLFVLAEQYELIPEDVTKLRNDAMAELNDVTKGLQSLALSGSPDVDLSAPVIVSRSRASSSDELLSLDNMEDW